MLLNVTASFNQIKHIRTTCGVNNLKSPFSQSFLHILGCRKSIRILRATTTSRAHAFLCARARLEKKNKNS